MEQERRGRILVNPSLQIYMLVYAGILALIFVIGTLITDYYFDYSVQELMSKLAETSDNQVMLESIRRVRQLKDTILIVVSSGFLLIWMLQAYIASSRIAGPVYKATKYLRDVSNGGRRYGLSFRQGDFFHELAEAVNKAIPPDKS